MIPRTRLGNQIVVRVREMIVSGALEGESRLREQALAARLGVSRTPLREALQVLERDGLVCSSPHQGFRVSPLSETAVREIYPMIGALEGLAVRTSLPKLRARVPDLRACNDKIAGARVGRTRHALDQRFHALLRADAANQRLVEVLASLHVHAQRYDGAAARGLSEPTRSTRDHATILAAIARGDGEAAARRVEAHWSSGAELVIAWLRRRAARADAAASALVLVAMLVVGCGRSRPPPAVAEVFAEAQWGEFVDEAAIEVLVARMSSAHQPSTVAFEHVSLLAMTHDHVDLDRTVVVEDGRIAAIGPAGEVPVPRGATIVDGRGRTLIPGLVDMHTHTELSSSHFLLDLANGVTSVREMDGFPWLLEMRARAGENRLLIPNLYVAGHILASQPMGWYATVVTSPEDARRVVREQRAAGYDFIKVHNLVDPPVYDAICDEAHRLGLDVVGHIPHGITIAHALTCPQRTFEHFKGYLLDETLTLTTEDYVAATAGAEVWNTPTFYAYREHVRGDDARRLLALPEMRYVPARDRQRWTALADEPARAIQLTVRPLEERVFRSLLPSRARMLAGTDSGGGYPYMVPGFALHEELRIFESLGTSPYDTLGAATTAPAEAMRRTAELGTIESGKRADLVLLDASPLEGIANLDRIDGVMVRGVWLERGTLDGMLVELARIDAASADRVLDRPAIDRTLDTLERLASAGHVLRTHLLGWLRWRCESRGVPTERPLFEGIVALAPDPDDG